MYSFTRISIGPRRRDGDRHQEGRQQDEGHGDAVDAELVEDGVREPVVLLDELEAGLRRVEAAPGDEAQDEGDEGGEQRNPARVATGRLGVSRQQQDERRSDQRQDQKAREDPGTGHQRAPKKRYQVAKAAAPSSIAKAY